ncbi:Beta-galactosidase BoGH2A [Collinsella intestinalis]|uniref:Beta-galactosidase BoGH2A n=1 Tax=Collinsella intestinalis TaxID=147207 RepID=A0A5K1IKK5_9ACTN|nr:sugar-binding domain-containing protein [Collinsella intestinalis]VWL88094.1 Beta-galactosidase BoGH2A [Collinsella intestinalis]
MKERLIQRRKPSHLICAIAAGALIATAPLTQTWAEIVPEVRSQSSTQMSSEPELVYISTVDNPALRVQNFNENWKFYLGDASGADGEQFDDSAWKNVDLPHDYSIDQEYTTAGEAESGYKLGGIGWYRKNFKVDESLKGKSVRIDFDGVYMDSTVWINGHRLGNHPYGYSPFSYDITEYLRFGELNTIAVKVNHQTPSSRWYSGSGIGRDVDLVVTDPVHVERDGVVVTTPELAADKTNVKTHLKTVLTNKGVEAASVTVAQTVFPRGGTLDQQIAHVESVVTTIAAGKSATVEQDALAANPTLWTVDAPTLYTVRTEIKQNGKVVDTYDVDFGYRFFSFDADTGFSLNGQNMKLKGVCMHHDQGALGSVNTRDAIERQVKILKEMGCNSIRATHNPHSRELTEICDEQGMLLVLEMFDGWTAPKNDNRNDYARFFNQEMGKSELIGSEATKKWAQFDLEQSMMRDINAPSVIMWSLGNEMTEGTSGIGNFQQVQKNLIGWAKAVDATRPVTTGDNKMKDGKTDLNPAGLAEVDGIVGFNYMDANRYKDVHREHPDWKLYGSETASATNSRGVYTNKNNNSLDSNKLLTSYDKSAVSWGHRASRAWFDTINNDFLAGEYVWTGFDYLGEPTPSNGTNPGAQGSWPSPKNSYFGIIDTAGLPKDTYYFYQSQWNDSLNTLHILPAWNRDAVMMSGGNKEVEVVVYTDAPEVELFFTPAAGGSPQSLGKKKLTQVTSENGGYTYRVYKGENGQKTPTHEDLYLTWNVPYADGTITAKAFDEADREISTEKWAGRKSVKTAGSAARLTASVNREKMEANGSDLAYLTVNVEDANGVIVPTAKNRVTFKVEGSGVLAGLDNGVQADHQSFRDGDRAAHAGQLVGIVRAAKNAGSVKVTVSAEGLEPATVEIPVEKVADQPADQRRVEALFYSRYQYVKKGAPVILPKQVEVRYADGTRSQQQVVWSQIGEGQLAKPGTFTVKGTVAGAEISSIVTIIDEVAALRNYSTTIPIKGEPVLPASRPAVMPDGTVMNVNFPIAWEQPAPDAFAQVGAVTVKGSASVFGKDMPVTALVRVQKGEVALGANIAPDAMRLTQDIPAEPEDMTSDTLEAIRNGSTTKDANNGGGRNQSCWSNWKWAQEGNRTSALTFNYATQQMLGQIKVYFGKDLGSGRYPDPGTITFEVSETGADNSWRRIEARETIAQNESSTDVKLYTYDFEPVPAVFVRMNIVNSSATDTGTSKPCTMITEVELMKATTSYPVGSEAALESLSVNGKGVPANVIASGSYDTRAVVAEVAATGKDNAAVTVLPAHDSKVKILLESEDHAATGEFVISLGAASSSPDLAADDDVRDYDVTKITPKASSEQVESGQQGPIKFAFDKNSDTLYHSVWAGAAQDQLYVDMRLADAATVEAVRYLPRQDKGDGSSNGLVETYSIWYRNGDGEDWAKCADGNWNTNDRSWQIAQFDKPVTATQFRFKAEKSVTNRLPLSFMSAAEIRLRTAAPTKDIASLKAELPSVVKVDRVDTDHPVLADRFDERIVDGDRMLVYGVDYLLTFQNNAAAGAAKVVVEGIGEYSGIIEHDFTIEVNLRKLTGIAMKQQPAKLIYAVGESFDPMGTELELSFSNGDIERVAYGEATKGDFVFDPAPGAAFEREGTVDVAVTYGGRTAFFTVTVKNAAQPDPGPRPPVVPEGGDGNAGNGNGSDTGIDGGNQDGAGSGATGGSADKPGDGLPTTGDDSLMPVAFVGVAGIATVAVGAAIVKRRRA